MLRAEVTIMRTRRKVDSLRCRVSPNITLQKARRCKARPGLQGRIRSCLPVIVHDDAVATHDFKQSHGEGLALCILGSWEYLQVKMAGGMHCAWELAQVEGAPSLLC